MLDAYWTCGIDWSWTTKCQISEVPEVPKWVYGCFDSIFLFLNDNCFHEK